MVKIKYKTNYLNKKLMKYILYTQALFRDTLIFDYQSSGAYEIKNFQLHNQSLVSLNRNQNKKLFTWLICLITGLFLALPNAILADEIVTNRLVVSNKLIADQAQKNPLEIKLESVSSGVIGGGSLRTMSRESLPLFIVDKSGYVGIGTDNVQHSLNIKGGPKWTSNGWGGAVALENASAIGWEANTSGNRFGIGHTNGGLYFFHTKSDPGTGSHEASYDLVIDDAGKVIVNSPLELKGGSDIAEAFDVSKATISNTPLSDIKPGFVVSIDPDNPGKLAVSSNAYDHRVAGIISGAGEIKPGMMLGQTGTIANGEHPIALTGRTYCWADTANGPIEPGDLLTTSRTPGHAMKVSNYAKAQGAILGKAMTGLREGKNLVLVLVTLQ